MAGVSRSRARSPATLRARLGPAPVSLGGASLEGRSRFRFFPSPDLSAVAPDAAHAPAAGLSKGLPLPPSSLSGQPEPRSLGITVASDGTVAVRFFHSAAASSKVLIVEPPWPEQLPDAGTADCAPACSEDSLAAVA
eukprot:CAMPEP_0113599720 /NCGR_PEP_ID=MMETSP0015_2-20120614/42308_1 /TAXON_ID=2838 /ORGANISM="Odontella" /LENGTH=136 /DNA_ID=CAMNT_0000507897 /DNA_START=576 /DNA_END=982 /DNA_ORIENTATION=+ /assembly_acc=CAM_ASM_000160